MANGGPAAATSPQGGSDVAACIRRSSITPPLRGSRREGGARSRAGGGQTPRPVSQYQQYAKQRQSPWISFVDFFFGRRGPASTPHRISLRLPARLLRLPLKGGVIINIGKQRQSPSWPFVPLGGSPSYCPRLSPLAGARWPPNSGSGITRAR